MALFYLPLLAWAQLYPRHATLHGDPDNSGYFGGLIAFGGNRLAVGTEWKNKVYIFDRTASGWTLQGRITATFTQNSYYELCNLAIDGDTVVIDNEIYVWNGAAWTLQATLPIHGSVAVRGDTLVVGDLGDNEGSAYVGDGALYVFVRSGTTWTQQAKLLPGVSGLHEGMGYTIALDGDTVIAGGYPFWTSNTGYYVFVRSGGTWTQQARIPVPSGSDPGWSIALEGNTAALAYPQGSKIYIYDRSGSTWTQTATVTPPPLTTGSYSYFGNRVSLAGGVLGALSEASVSYPTSRYWTNGHLFVRTSSGWVQTQRFESSATIYDAAVANGLKAFAFGNPNASYGASGDGAVELYDIAATPAPGSGWSSYDVGPVGVAGGDSANNGTVTVSGAGADIWNGNDAFHYRAETMTGDGTIVARVANPGTGNGWAKIGLMMREDLAEVSRNVMAVASPGNHIGLQTRTETAGTTSFIDGGWTGFPTWLMLDRQGNTFTAYRSYDGSNWTPMGSTTVTMPATIYVGLAASSHDTSTLITATFDNVQLLGGVPPPPPPSDPPAAPSNLQAGNQTSSTINLSWTDNSSDETGFQIERAQGGSSAAFAMVTTTAANATRYVDSGLTPNTMYTYRVRAARGTTVSAATNDYTIWTLPQSAPGWNGADIGAVGVAGSNSGASDQATLHAAGSDIWNAADSFRFYYQAWHGDGEIKVRVTGLTNTHPWAKAGVMFRETLDAGSRNAAMVLTAANVCGFQARTTAGAATTFTDGPWVNPVYWVRLTRAGDTFSGYISPDGNTWTLIGSQTIAMAVDIYVGVAASSHDTSALTTASFDNIMLPSAPPPPPPATWTMGNDIGNTAISGSNTFSGGTLTLTASGDDIWNAADGCRFVYQSWAGDGEIVARVDSLANTHPWAKAGVMFRENLTAGARNVAMLLTAGNTSGLQVRDTANGTTSFTTGPWVNPTYWVRLVRAGNTFSAYVGPDGNTWTLVGSQTVSLASSLYVGLVASSHNNAAATTAIFTNITMH